VDEDCFCAEIMMSVATTMAVTMTMIMTMAVFYFFVGVVTSFIVTMVMAMRKGFGPPFLLLRLDVVAMTKIVVRFLCSMSAFWTFTIGIKTHEQF
jgi:hypothetical protein